MSNKVFIATSLDGYIADKEGKIDWLHSIPNPENNDMGYSRFMEGIDTLVMGRITFETVLSFGIDWPYQKPVFVLSRKLKEIPPQLADKVFLLHGEVKEVLKTIRARGHQELYIDGGKTIQAFLEADLIDEITITIIPIILGEGTPLFNKIAHPLNFRGIDCKRYLNTIIQTTYKRVRSY